MNTEDLIPAADFCYYHSIDLTFVRSLNESKLIDIVIIEEKEFLQIDQLTNLEKMVRLHYEMEVNIEGIETINHLLNQIREMKSEINLLTDKVKFYEGEVANTL